MLEGGLLTEAEKKQGRNHWKISWKIINSIFKRDFNQKSHITKIFQQFGLVKSKSRKFGIMHLSFHWLMEILLYILIFLYFASFLQTSSNLFPLPIFLLGQRELLNFW